MIKRAKPKDLRLGTKFLILTEDQAKKFKPKKDTHWHTVRKKLGVREHEDNYEQYKEHLKNWCTKGFKTMNGQAYIYIGL